MMKVRMNRRQFLKAFGLAVATYAVGGVGLYEYGKRVEAERLSVERVEIPLRGLQPALEGFKIVHMSDLHLRPHTTLGFLREAVALANSLKPDLTVLTGDYITDEMEAISELAPVLGGLDARRGVFACLGNHEVWNGPDVARAALEQAGLSVLVNDGAAFDVGGAPLYLAGLDDPWDGQPDLEAALRNAPRGAPVILLAHEPDFADEFSRDGRVSLQLSGHTHGGQVCLPGLGALVLPPHGEKYTRGRYNVNGMWVYTTRGVGACPIPSRVNCPPEVTEITLVRM